MTVEPGTKMCCCHGTVRAGLGGRGVGCHLEAGATPIRACPLELDLQNKDKLWVVLEQRGVELLCRGLLEGELTVPVKVEFFHNHSQQRWPCHYHYM